jgi:hypothetical protein
LVKRAGGQLPIQSLPEAFRLKVVHIAVGYKSLSFTPKINFLNLAADDSGIFQQLQAFFHLSKRTQIIYKRKGRNATVRKRVAS